MLHTDSFKEYLPNGFHEVDNKGRPVFYIHVGQTKLTQLMKILKPAALIKFFVKELEHTWRERFEQCEA